MILSHIIQGNQRCKDLLLDGTVTFGDQQGSLFTLVTTNLLISEDFDVRVVVGLLALLVVWLHESEKSVNAFLSETSNFQFVTA